MKKNVIAVIGPTASGKTSLAIQIAKKFNGELINTDSRQIYKFMDIGTAKGPVVKILNSKFEIPNKYEIKNPNIKTLEIWEIEDVSIHLINIVAPNEVLSLAQYQKLAYAAIEDILNRGKLPILVGGTGLYIDAITKGYTVPGVKPNMKLREKLSKYSTIQLQDKLIELNKDRFENLNNSDKNNPRRLMRLIEIETTNKDIKRKEFTEPDYNFLLITPKRSRKELYDRINKRAKILVESGLINEVKVLIAKGYDFSKPAMTAISYPMVKNYLDGKISKDELIEQFAQGDRNYARRQITWFKRYKVQEIIDFNEAEIVIKNFLSQYD